MTRQKLLRAALSSALSLCIPLPGACLARGQGSNPAHVCDQSESRTQAQPSASKACEHAAQPSLGDLARKQRAEQAQAAEPPARVYTNENLPGGTDSVSIVGPPEAEAAPAQAVPGGELHRKHGEQYDRAQMSELQQRLDTHQRELEVLEQKLGENQVQYYANPSEALEQQHSREDISRITDAIGQKKQQVEADQRAIADLEDEVRRQGGDVTGLERVGKSTAPITAAPDLTGVEKGSAQYWRLRFKAAREAVARAQEEQQLTEDELALLQSQQAHEMGTAAAPEAAPKIADKQAEVESKRAATVKAQQQLDSLEQDFEHSGAPEEWSQPEEAGTGDSSPQ